MTQIQTQVAELMQPRFQGASVNLDPDMLFITGGISKISEGKSLNTTEYVRLNNNHSFRGPTLPYDFVNHCATKFVNTFGQEYIVLTGGNAGTESKTLLVDLVNDFSAEG